MSIDYDDDDLDDYDSCGCCDYEEEPVRTWEDIAFDVARAFDGATKNFDRAFEERKYPPPIWWVPMDGFPGDVYITEGNETEDINVSGCWPMTQLVGRRIYINRQRSSSWLNNAGVDTFPIKAYMQKVAEGMIYISAVLSVQPPPWGWWMPSLEGWT